MSALSSFSDSELLERLVSAVRTERKASVDVMQHLAEVERRGLAAGDASGSLYKYCTEPS